MAPSEGEAADRGAWTVVFRRALCSDGMGPGFSPYTVEVRAPWFTSSGCAYRAR